MKTCLSIAGSDPSGGAGIQADLKTFAANGVYGMSVITALTAQNTTGVKDIYTIPGDFVKEQLECVFEDIPPDAVKIGMQGDADSIRVICDILSGYKKNTMADAAEPDLDTMKIVIDPVMVSTSGHDLINEESYRVLCDYLLPMADIITPNLPEAEKLTGMTITSHKGMLDAAKLLRRYFDCSVLIKGGHALFCDTFTEYEKCLFSTGQTMPGNVSSANESAGISNHEEDANRKAEKDSSPVLKHASTDLLLLFDDDKPVFLYSDRIDNPNTHGTGCTLSSAIAAGLALGKDMKTAVREAKAYITGAIKAGLDLGKGRGPLDHMYNRT